MPKDAGQRGTPSKIHLEGEEMTELSFTFEEPVTVPTTSASATNSLLQRRRQDLFCAYPVRRRDDP